MCSSRAIKSTFLFIVVLVVILPLRAQQGGTKWSPDGNAYYRIEQNEIVKYILPANTKETFISKQQLTPAGQSSPLRVNHYALSSDGKKVLIFTNTKRVWRINTRGEYWVLDLQSNSLKKLGTGRP